MNREELDLAIKYDSRIRKIDDTLEVLHKPMLVLASNMTGHIINFNSLDDETVRLLKKAMIEALESRKQVLVERLQRL